MSPSKPRTRASIRMPVIRIDLDRVLSWALGWVLAPALALLTLPGTAAAADPAAAWRLLDRAVAEPRVAGDRLLFDKTFPDDLRAAAEDFAVEGFFVPVLAEPYIETFLLVETPANCPFCGDGGYAPVLEVYLKTPMQDRAEFSLIAVTGRLEFVNDPETLQMFRLVDARLRPGS